MPLSIPPGKPPSFSRRGDAIAGLAGHLTILSYLAGIAAIAFRLGKLQ